MTIFRYVAEFSVKHNTFCNVHLRDITLNYTHIKHLVRILLKYFGKTEYQVGNIGKCSLRVSEEKRREEEKKTARRQMRSIKSVG